MKDKETPSNLMQHELHSTQTTLGLSDHDLSPANAGRYPVGLWHCPAVIAENHFVHKSLSNWAFNIAVGCAHACRFCYVPDAATIKQGAALAKYGVQDPDAQWGDYLLLRPWDEARFLASLRSAENTPRSRLKRDGNRAVIYCSTTDPYQVIRHPDPVKQRVLAQHARLIVRRSLELIRDSSTLNVRVLTRSPKPPKALLPRTQAVTSTPLNWHSPAAGTPSHRQLARPRAPASSIPLRCALRARQIRKQPVAFRVKPHVSLLGILGPLATGLCFLTSAPGASSPLARAGQTRKAPRCLSSRAAPPCSLPSAVGNCLFVPSVPFLPFPAAPLALPMNSPRRVHGEGLPTR